MSLNTVTVNWNHSQVLKLIKLFQEREILWNKSRREFRDRVKIREAWGEIASALNLKNGIIAEKKMKSLMSQFHRELKKSSGTDECCQWFAYKKLMFLKNMIKSRKTSDVGLKKSETVKLDACEDPEIEKNLHDPREILSPRTYTTYPENEKSTFNPPLEEKQRHTESAQNVDTHKKTQFVSTAELAGLDDSKAYANYLACKFSQYSRQTRNALQYETSRLLFQADNGYFETPAYGTYPTDLRSNDPLSTCSSSTDNVDYTLKVSEIGNDADN